MQATLFHIPRLLARFTKVSGHTADVPVVGFDSEGRALVVDLNAGRLVDLETWASVRNYTFTRLCVADEVTE
jgi:hypothetical protein